MIIDTGIRCLRDPFILVDNGVYYAYGTGVEGEDHMKNTWWTCYKNTSGKLDGNWVKVEDLAVVPSDASKNRWAPEVHKYKGDFYMFTTYYSSVTEHRGCTILKSSSPEGPFVEITNGHITPHEWDCIDGTLYIDGDGQPWMVFVHEWTCTDDGIGRMAVAKLSDDFTHLVSEPVELFRADSPSWTDRRVTDGCFLYTTCDNKLLMIWSNFESNGEDYCVGIAHSKNGKVDGEWVQDDELLFSKRTTGKYDGGHGMIFKDTDGKMYLSVHSPNLPCEEFDERTILVEIKEENGTLVCVK